MGAKADEGTPGRSVDGSVRISIAISYFPIVIHGYPPGFFSVKIKISGANIYI